MSIVFHDGRDEPNDRIQGPKLHHFRSSTFASELILSSTDDKRVSKEDMTPEANLESKDITCASSKSKDINISKPNSKRDKMCDDDRSASISTPDLKPTSSGTPSYVCTIAERLSSIIGHTQNLKGI